MFSIFFIGNFPFSNWTSTTALAPAPFDSLQLPFYGLLFFFHKNFIQRYWRQRVICCFLFSLIARNRFHLLSIFDCSPLIEIRVFPFFTFFTRFISMIDFGFDFSNYSRAFVHLVTSECGFIGFTRSANTLCSNKIDKIPATVTDRWLLFFFSFRFFSLSFI